MIGSEQVAPRHMKAAPSGAEAIFARAGCEAGSASAVGARSTMRSRKREPERGRGEDFGVRARSGHDDLGAAQAQVERVAAAPHARTSAGQRH